MYQRLKTQMEERFSGTKNAGRPMLLDGGLDWKQFGMNMVDLQALEMKRDASREIALAFGVPPMLLGIPGDNTYSNYQEASRAFYRQTALPLAETLYGAIGRWWTAAAGGNNGVEGVELYCDPEQLWALADELAMKWGRVMGSLVHTTNEKRTAISLPPVKDASGAGDVVLVSAALVPLANVVEPPMPADYAGVGGRGLGGRGGAVKPDRRADGDGDGKIGEGTGGVV
jgi:HK97 family phage portal protein